MLDSNSRSITPLINPIETSVGESEGESGRSVGGGVEALANFVTLKRFNAMSPKFGDLFRNISGNNWA